MKVNTVDKAAKRISETNKLMYSKEVEEAIEKADRKLEQDRLKKELKRMQEKQKMQKRIDRINKSAKGLGREL